MRIWEIARQAGTDSKSVRTYLSVLGVNVKSASSVVGPPQFAQQVVESLKNR